MTAPARSGAVCFVVEGAFITETARRLWAEEDEPEKALNLLECIRELTEGQRLDILEGRSKLTGDSSAGIALEPDTVKGASLRAVVKKLKTERDEARDERADLVQLACGDTVMVASPTGAREVPRRKAKTWFGSDGTLSRSDGKIGGGGGYLEDGVEFDDVLEELERRNESSEKALKRRKSKPLRIYREMRQPVPFESSMEGIARISEEVDEEAKAEERHLREAEEDRVAKLEDARFEAARQRAAAELKPQTKITNATGWLTPEGIFYECPGYAQHARVAWALGHTSHPTNHMVEIAGWARLGVNNDEQYFFGDVQDFTEKQNKLIREWCAESGAKLPYHLRKDEES